MHVCSREKFNEMSGFLIDYLESIPEVTEISFTPGTMLREGELDTWDQVRR